MTYRPSNANREASLELSLAAMKSLVSNYVTRANQAEQLAGHLLLEKLDPNQMATIERLVTEQIKFKDYERSIQQQAVLQATLLAVNACIQCKDPDEQRRMLILIARDLAMCVEHSEPVPPQ